MSFIHNLDDKSDIFEPEVEISVRHDDVKKKFGLYRSNTEQITAKYRESKGVLDRLKDEIQVSREMEKSQRIRILSLQSRLSAFEEKWKKLNEISEKQRSNSEEIRKIDSDISNVTNLIKELKEKFQAVISSTIKEIDAVKANRDLQSVLEAKEVELQLLNAQLKSVTSEKDYLVKKYETENERLREEVEKSKSDANDTKNHFENQIKTYKQKILDCERIIENLEQERKSILGDYIDNTTQGETNAAAAGNNSSDKAITWPDSTVTCLPERRENTTESTDLNLTSRKDECQGHRSFEFKPSLPQSQKTCQDRINSQFSKITFKQKPKLHFLDSTSDISVVNQQPQPKKRLYSQNSNHYIN